jgi:ribosome-associated toxin RatA of RatAB toxin-antitoxin module
MQAATASRTVSAGLPALWPLIADVRQIANWHPSIASVDLLSSSPTGLRAARRCNFKDGTSVREDVTALTEGSRIRFRLSEYSVPMKQLEVEFATSPVSDHATNVTLTLHYVVKFGIVGRLLGATIMRRALTRMAKRMLDGLAASVTEGRAPTFGAKATA